MDNSVNLLNKMKWLTESKALEKSKAKTVTQSASPVSSDLICWLLMRASPYMQICPTIHKI